MAEIDIANTAPDIGAGARREFAAPMACSLRPSTRRFARMVALIAALHAILWAYFIPPGQGPDEEAHFGAVEHIFYRGTPPIIGEDFRLTKNWREALEATGFSRIRLSRILKPTFADYEDRHPKSEFTDGDSYHSGSPGGPPLYYYFLSIPYGILASLNTLDRIYFLRLTGALFAAFTTCMYYQAFRAIVGDSNETRAAALVVALFPMFGFLNGYITTDSGAMAVMAAAIAIGLRDFHNSKPSYRSTAVSGLLCGAAFLAKPFAASCAIPLFLFHLFSSDSRRIKLAALFAVTALAVNLPWIAWSYSTYGGLTAHAAMHIGARPGFVETLRLYSSIASPSGLFSQAVGVFGWLDTPLPREIRAAIAIMFIGGWILFLRETLGRRVSIGWWKIAAFGPAHLAFVLAAAIHTTMSSGYRLGLQGRYLLLPIAAWIAPPIVGWVMTFPRSARIITAGSLVSALFALGWVVIPRYYL